jgi:all-trans-retinol 13,14-reductase
MTIITEAVIDNVVGLIPKELKLPENGLLSLLMGAGAGLLLLAILGFVRHRRYVASLPKYTELPDTALHHMASKEELKQFDHKLDIAIIGSGMGALTTASILCKCTSYKVAVFEQHSTIGGSTQMYHHNAYDFDVGVHYVGGRLGRFFSVFRMLYNYLSDGQLQWNRIAKTYDVAYNATTGERLEFTGDHPSDRQVLLDHFGSSLDPVALDRYYKKCHQARSVAYVSWALKCLPPFVTRVVWKLGFGKLYRRLCMPTTLQTMRDCGLNENVIGALTYSYGDYGTTPAESPFFVQAFMDNHYEGGAYFPKGGSTSIAKTLVATIQRHGGQVFAHAEVEGILTRKTFFGRHQAIGVRVKGVDIHTRTAVISDAGFSKTFEVDPFGKAPLVPQVASAKQLAMVHKKDRPPLLPPSHAFCYLFVGLEGTDTELELLGQNIWHVKDWHHDESLNELYKAKHAQDTADMEPPLVFLSNQSAKDPDYAKSLHPNKATVALIAWTKLEWFREWSETTQGHRGAEYDQFKTKMTNKLLDVLYLHFPKTKGRVVVAELGTPLSANKYLGRGSGEIYNLDHAVGRFDSLDAQLALHPQTSISNLYLCGQDAVAVSIEGATISGVFVAARVSFMAMLVVCLPAAAGLLAWI